MSDNKRNEFRNEFRNQLVIGLVNNPAVFSACIGADSKGGISARQIALYIDNIVDRLTESAFIDS